MEQEREYPVCGFIPSYVLQAISRNSSFPEESRTACRNTLEHTHAYVTERHEIFPKSFSILKEAQKVLTGGSAAGAKTETGTGLNRKIYDCKESERRPGLLVRSEGDPRGKDRQVNNCYDGFKITHDFFSKVYGRNSLDGKGLPLVGSVHYKPRNAPGGYNNAFWDGNAKQMVFGDGDHISFDYLTDSLDVIAHELSHGFVQFSSPLDYVGQSGALNESCADIFGSMVEQWHMNQDVENADWNLGQTLFPVIFTGSGLRTFRATKAYTDDPVFETDPQPKHMDQIYTGTGDAGGVHINSGIPNHAFYLACKKIGGYSWEKVGKVWYKTMTSGKILPTCDFVTFAKVTVEIAEKEFEDDAVKNAIRDAWIEVGVLPAA